LKYLINKTNKFYPLKHKKKPINAIHSLHNLVIIKPLPEKEYKQNNQLIISNLNINIYQHKTIINIIYSEDKKILSRHYL
jgi:hypothetical protein